MPKIWSNFAQRTPAVLDFPLGGRSRETGGVNGGGKGANGGGGGNGIDVLTQRSVVSTAGNSRASFGKFPFLKWKYVEHNIFFSSLNGWNIFESFCNTCLSSCINDIFWPTGADLEEENCFIQPPFSDFLVRFFLTIMFVTPTECSRYIWTSGRHSTFKCPSGFVLSHQHKEVFILYFTYSRQLPLVMWHVVHLTIWKEIIIVWDIIQTSVKTRYRV